jgi:hypothetical protein
MLRIASAAVAIASAAVARADHKHDDPPPQPDGTIQSQHIWLKGRRYRFTEGLRNLLSYLLTHDGAAQDDVVRHCAYSASSHLHKRLKDLRDRLPRELKKSGWRLQIRTEEARIYCEWRKQN